MRSARGLEGESELAFATLADLLAPLHDGLADEDADLTGEVQALVSAPTPGVVAALGDRGVEYVVLASPADGRISARLDATAGLEQASAEDRSTRAWRVDRPLDATALVHGLSSHMRSTELDSRLPKLKPPPVDEGSLTRTPSITTSVWSASAPRIRTLVSAPIVPLRVTVTPGVVASRSETTVV